MGKTLVLLILLFIFVPKTLAMASDVVINEFLPSPSSGNSEWVEFYNPDGVDISTYWLDDDADFNIDSGTSSKKSLSTLNISNINYPYIEISSFLNNSGDNVVLFTSDGTIVDQYQYIQNPGTDISIGRYPNGTGSFIVLSVMTKGSANSDPPTPTPTNIPTPTITPAFTKTPTPTKVPTPTVTPKISPTIFNTPTLVLNPTTILTSSKNTSQDVDIEEDVELSQDILGENIATKTSNLSLQKDKNSSPSIIPTPITKSEKETNNVFPKIILATGVIFLVCCAILAFRSLKKNKKEEEE